MGASPPKSRCFSVRVPDRVFGGMSAAGPRQGKGQGGFRYLGGVGGGPSWGKAGMGVLRGSRRNDFQGTSRFVYPQFFSQLTSWANQDTAVFERNRLDIYHQILSPNAFLRLAPSNA
jgi:hypothetical protein